MEKGTMEMGTMEKGMMERRPEDPNAPLLASIRETESRLRGHLERLHQCLDRIESIRTSETVRYHGLLLTLRSGLAAVSTLEERGWS